MKWLHEDDYENHKDDHKHAKHVKSRIRYDYVLQKQYKLNFLTVMSENELMERSDLLILEPLTEFRRFIADEFMENDLLK